MSGTVWQMEFAALLMSVIALAVSTLVGWRAIRLSRQANAVPMLVDLFREHRSAEMAKARRFVYTQLAELNLSGGLASLTDDGREMIRVLSCYYDNLGALVAHGIVDLDIVAGYMGSSVVSMWDEMQPLIAAERAAAGRLRQRSLAAVLREPPALDQTQDTFRRPRCPTDVVGALNNATCCRDMSSAAKGHAT